MPKSIDYPPIAKTGKDIEAFVPAQFQIVKSAVGDLNQDKIPDAVVHLMGTATQFLNKNESLGEQVFDTNPRILIVLFRNKSNTAYTLVEQTNQFIIPPCGPVCSEPLRGISIKKGVLNLDFELWQSAGSWGATNAFYKFKYLNGRFFLIGADREDYMRNSGESEKLSYNFLTSRQKTEIGNIEDGKIRKITWKGIKKRPLKTFKTFPKPFKWEIRRDIYI